jgi:hypothetical protein
MVVSGMAQFRPSGKLLVIHVEHLGPALLPDVRAREAWVDDEE